MGVVASPADRKAPLSMKKSIMPKLKTNMMRRYGSASTWTSAVAFTRPRRAGLSTYPRGAINASERKDAVRKAWKTVRFTASGSLAPAKRATSTPIPVKMELRNTTTTRKICQDTPMAAFPTYPT
jgi:hypothetical protein